MNINKKNLLVTKFTEKGGRPALSGVHFTPDYTEATNGHMAVRISYPEQIKPEDLPEEIHTAPAGEIKPFLVSAEALGDVKFYKSGKNAPLPWMEQVYVDVNQTNANGRACFYATNMESKSAQEIAKMEDQYPDTDKVWPGSKAPILQICVDPDYMKELAEIAVKVSQKDSRKHGAMLLSIYGPMEPVRIETCDLSAGQSMDAILMPMRWNTGRFGAAKSRKEDIKSFYTAVRRFARIIRSYTQSPKALEALDAKITSHIGFVEMFQKVLTTL